MQSIKTLILIFLVGLLSGCTTYLYTDTRSYSRIEIDDLHDQTFQFAPGLTDNISLVGQVQAIRFELERDGLTYKPHGQATYIVDYHYTANHRKEVHHDTVERKVPIAVREKKVVHSDNHVTTEKETIYGVREEQEETVQDITDYRLAVTLFRGGKQVYLTVTTTQTEDVADPRVFGLLLRQAFLNFPKGDGQSQQAEIILDE